MFKRLFMPLFLLLLVLLAGLTSLVSAQTATPIPTLTPLVVTAGPTIFYVTTLTPSPTPGCSAPLPMVKGQSAYVKGGMYVRNQPTEFSPWVNYYQKEVVVIITGEGPSTQTLVDIAQ